MERSLKGYNLRFAFWNVILIYSAVRQNPRLLLNYKFIGEKNFSKMSLWKK